MRAPAYPLITVDPYFSIWSMSDELNKSTTKHWGGADKTIEGLINIDGTDYVFMGIPRSGQNIIEQKSVKMDICSTEYIFEGHGIRLSVLFTTPFIPSDLDTLSTPVSFMKVSTVSVDNKEHKTIVTVRVCDQICINDNIYPTKVEDAYISDDMSCMRVGSIEQSVLGRSGDVVCIDWGYFYLAIDKPGTVEWCRDHGRSWLCATREVDSEALFVFGYDDIYCIDYFGKKLSAYWKHNGTTIEEAIRNYSCSYNTLVEKCSEVNERMKAHACTIGGDMYFDLLVLAYRQVFAAHKLTVDENGEILYISKECLSGGLAATADVSYPSAPLFLIYCPELVKGMLRPIFKFSRTDLWNNTYAPHDAGMYPILRGQIYSGCNLPDRQMPVEECGNMLILSAAVTVVENNSEFAEKNMDLLTLWADYLVDKGMYPANQLCTDDFAGFMANNCNLSLKAILGIASYAIICRYIGDFNKEQEFMNLAKKMAAEWLQNASNVDGSTKLAFDYENSYSLKYNAIWDKLFGLNLFPDSFYKSEFECYKAHMNPYGIPLDTRVEYTKSDWYMWCACFTDNKEEFEDFIRPLYNSFIKTPSRVPMTDWYSTITSFQCGFQHRSVQGGLWIKLLQYYKLYNSL